MSTVRLPRSAYRRGVLDCARLLHRIDPRKPGFFGLIGQLLEPGSLIEEEHLRPDPDWPATPLLLETSHSAHSRAGHHGTRLDFRLWRYVEHEWQELARIEGADQGGYLQLMPLIEQALTPARLGLAPVDISPSVTRVVTALDEELDRLRDGDRWRLCSAVYLELSMRACRAHVQLAG